MAVKPFQCQPHLQTSPYLGTAPARVRRAFLLCLLCALLPACSLFAKEEPEPKLLEQRTGAFIDIGWSWLHAENVRLLRGSWQGERYSAVFEYDIVLDAAVESLPAFERERFATFLPMCADQGREKGAVISPFLAAFKSRA